jgi:DNA gyrase subunit A
LLCNGGLAHTGLIDVDCEAGYDPGPTPPEGAYYRIPTGRRIGGALRSFLLPHHHGRVVNSLDYLLDHPHATTEDVLGILKGPDLPTGGRISNPEDLARIYQEGEGSLKVCARTELENPKEGGRYLRVRELAYGDTTGQLIADLLHRRGCEVRPVPEDGDPIGYQIDLRIRLEPGEDPQALLDEHGGFEREIRVRMAVMADGREAVFSFLDLMKAYLANLRDSLGESAGSSTRVRSELRKWKELVEVVEVGGQPRTMIPDHD